MNKLSPIKSINNSTQWKAKTIFP